MGPPTPDQLIPIRITVKSSDIQGLRSLARDISTPGNPSYGKFLTVEALKKFVSPPPASLGIVTDWVKAHNLNYTLSTLGNVVQVDATVGEAEKLMAASYVIYSQNANGQTIVRTRNFTIPDDVRAVTEFIYPLDQLDTRVGGLPKNGKQGRLATRAFPAPPTPASCAKLMTPLCIATLYSIPTQLQHKKMTTLTVNGFINQFAQFADLKTFLDIYRPDLAGNTFNVTLFANGTNPQGPGLGGDEANLDIQYTVGLVNGLDVNFASFGRNDTISIHLDLMESVFSAPGDVSVISQSYGANEQGLGQKAAQILCDGYMAVSTLGISTLVASGDDGVAGPTGDGCEGQKFRTLFSATCPFVTSVGATLYDGEKEVAVTSFGSGGGFSDVFPRPWYQDEDIPAYVNSVLNDPNVADRFNPSGRGIPDISAIGDNVDIINNGKHMKIGGTSLSTPIVASMVALVNNELKSSGRHTMGLLNPLLYANKQLFNDVLVGSNPGCGSTGFNVSKGWDPVTGLGTIGFDALLKAAFEAQSATPRSNALKAPPGQYDTVKGKLYGKKGRNRYRTYFVGRVTLGQFIGIMIGAGVLLIVIAAALVCMCRSKRTKKSVRITGSSFFPSQTQEYRALNEPAPDAGEYVPRRPPVKHQTIE